MVPEDRSYETQYFAKIFPSSFITFIAANSFYIHFQESAQNALLIVIAVKRAAFSAPESASETTLETMYFILFLKKVTKNLEKKLVIKFVLMKQISFTYISFFYILYYFVIGENSRAMHGWRKIVCMNPQLYFFP